MHAKATCIDKIIHAKCLKIIDKMHANILLQMKMNQVKITPNMHAKAKMPQHYGPKSERTPA